MPDVSDGETWVLNLLAEMATALEMSEARGSWPPSHEEFTTGMRHLTITLGTKQRREVFLVNRLEDVLTTPRFQLAIRKQLCSALLAIR